MQPSAPADVTPRQGAASRREPSSEPSAAGSSPPASALAVRSRSASLAVNSVPRAMPDEDWRPSASAPGSPGRRRGRRRLVWVAALTFVGVAAALSALSVVFAARETPAGPGRRVVVLPFSVRGAGDQEFLAEGMVDLLSSGLDGAGDLVAVSPPAVLGYLARETPGPLDTRDRARAARHFGADLFVVGDVVAVDDRVRVSAWLYRTDAPGVPVQRADAEGSAEDVLGLTDRIVISLAAGPEGGAGSRLARVASASTSSLPAMKEYLEGQRLYRNGDVNGAIEAFQAAVDADSTFALGSYALSVAASAAFQGGLADDAMSAAVRHMDRLPARERDLLRARVAYRTGDASRAERLTRALVARHPNDAETWDQLGEVLFHLNPLRGRSVEEAREPFERVRALDPGPGEPGYHLAQLAALRGDWRSVARLTEEGLGPVDMLTHRVHQLRVLRRAARQGGVVDSAFIATELRNADDFSVVSTAYTLAVFLSDNPGAAEALAILDRNGAPAARSYSLILRAQLDLAGGRWNAARQALGRAASIDPGRVARYGALLRLSPWLPADTAALETARTRLATVAGAGAVGPTGAAWQDADLPVAGIQRLFLDGWLAVRLGRAADASTAMDSLAMDGSRPLLASSYARVVGTALVPESGHGDPLTGGLAGISPEEAVLSPFFSLPIARFRHAAALASDGQDDDALDWYASLGELSIPDLVYRAPAHLRQAAILEARGDSGAAAAHYRAFVALWADCDPSLRPLVDQARARLAALADP